MDMPIDIGAVFTCFRDQASAADQQQDGDQNRKDPVQKEIFHR